MMKQAVKRALLVLTAVMCLTTAVISVSMALMPPQSAALSLSLTPFATGLSSPVSIANADAGYGRLFIVERAGRIKIVEANGAVLPTPFLDISGRVTSGGELGLLGLAFHPDYRDNGIFYVNYTNGSGANRQTRISRFNVTADPNTADPDSEEILLTIVQPDTNHNAGDIHFGPDGYLYIPLGDGGGGNDTNNNAQNLSLALGKIVRIDVDSGGANLAECNNVGGSGNYGIPPSNPFVGSDTVCDLIWATGLRNPWRSSFDRLTGDLYIGDVGQGAWEEVDYQPITSTGGEDYGWSCYEGNHANPPGGCQPEDVPVHTPPIFEFESINNCSVINGYVYRGTQYPAMNGHYLVTDYCSGNFWDLVVDDTGLFTPTMHTNLTDLGYVSFGEAANCELYLANINNGTVYHIQENTFSSAAVGNSELCNNRPVAVNDIYTTTWNAALVVLAPGVLDNDGDSDGDTLTAVLDTPPSNGSLTLAATGAVIYTPTTNFIGTDSFTYHAFDGLADSNMATVVIEVVKGNAPPVAISNTYTMAEATSLIVAPPGVLVNDTDANGDVLSAVLHTPPISGSLALNLDGSFIFTPTLGFTGEVTFTYRAHDGLAASNIAVVTILVKPNTRKIYIQYITLRPPAFRP